MIHTDNLFELMHHSALLLQGLIIPSWFGGTMAGIAHSVVVSASLLVHRIILYGQVSCEVHSSSSLLQRHSCNIHLFRVLSYEFDSNDYDWY